MRIYKEIMIKMSNNHKRYEIYGYKIQIRKNKNICGGSKINKNLKKVIKTKKLKKEK